LGGRGAITVPLAGVNIRDPMNIEREAFHTRKTILPLPNGRRQLEAGKHNARISDNEHMQP
jgi:hypothetical protein